MKKQILAGILGVSLIAFFAIPSFALVGEGDQIGKAELQNKTVDGVKLQIVIVDYECDNCYRSGRTQTSPDCYSDKCRVDAGVGTCAKKYNKCVCRVPITNRVFTGPSKQVKTDVTK